MLLKSLKKINSILVIKSITITKKRLVETSRFFLAFVFIIDASIIKLNFALSYKAKLLLRNS